VELDSADRWLVSSRRAGFYAYLALNRRLCVIQDVVNANAGSNRHKLRLIENSKTQAECESEPLGSLDPAVRGGHGVDEAALSFLNLRERELIAALAAIRRAKAALLSQTDTQGQPLSTDVPATVARMVEIAFAERFPEGATSAELLTYLHDRWGHNSSANAMHVALWRMGRSGLIRRVGRVWFLRAFDDAESETDHPQVGVKSS